MTTKVNRAGLPCWIQNLLFGENLNIQYDKFRMERKAYTFNKNFFNKVSSIKQSIQNKHIFNFINKYWQINIFWSSKIQGRLMSKEVIAEWQKLLNQSGQSFKGNQVIKPIRWQN